MSVVEELSGVPGAVELEKWFGYWPTFHDAEVLSIHLNRTGASAVRVHGFEMTKDLDPQGFYILAKHVIVTFALEEISTLELQDFNNQNVLSGLSLRRQGEEYELSLEGIYGVDGRLCARRVCIELEPGLPRSSE